MLRVMKYYTRRALTQDAKVFNQLRLEYRQAKKNRRKDAWRFVLKPFSAHSSRELSPLTKGDTYETSH